MAAVSRATLFRDQERRLRALTIRFVDREIFVARRTEGIEHACLFDCLDAVRNMTCEIKRIPGRELMRCPLDNQPHPPAQDVDDLFLGMVMFRHFAAGIEPRGHLIHRLSACRGLALDAGTNFDPRVFLFHSGEGAQSNCKTFL